MLSQTGAPERRLGGAAIKIFESHGEREESVIGVYLTMPTARKALGHQWRGESALWQTTDLFEGPFAVLRDFVRGGLCGPDGPLSEVGRVWLLISEGGGAGVRHYDHDDPRYSSDFVWLRTGPTKQLCVRAAGRHAPDHPQALAASLCCSFRPLLCPKCRLPSQSAESPAQRYPLPIP